MRFPARPRPARPRPPAPPAPAERPPLSPAEVRRGLRCSTIEGALANVHISITTGAFVTGFALLLGARDFELGVMGALPFLGQLFQFIGAYLEERWGTRKQMVLYSALVSRCLWAIIAALPFMRWLGAGQLLAFLVVLGASQAVMGISSNAWTSWMSDLVPPRERGRYFGVRNTVAAVSVMISTWLAGMALDHFRGAGDEPLGYTVIFSVAVVFAIIAGCVLTLQPEPPMQRRAEQRRVGDLFSAPLRHARFRSFTLAATGWAVATGVASSFFNAYGLQNLHVSYQTLALFGIATSAVNLFTQPYIGQLQDKFGDKTVLIISVLGTVALPWGWVFATPDFLLPVWLTSIFSGVFWPGINQGLMNLLMDRAPAEGRGAYVAAFGAVNGAGTFAASLLGGVLATALSGTVLHLGGLEIGHYAVLFVISSVGRLAMAWVFSRAL